MYDHQIVDWATRREWFPHYVQLRRKYCNFKKKIDLTILAPYCSDCARDRVYFEHTQPDITEYGWELDILLFVGPSALARIKRELKKDENFSFQCRGCGDFLVPWNGDEVHVVSNSVEETYSIISGPRRDSPNVPNQIKNEVFNVYGHKCFKCKRKKNLHIDHIKPRSQQGNSSFINLQPLCEKCGNLKGDCFDGDVEVVNTMYFGPYPGDAYEGLFW